MEVIFLNLKNCFDFKNWNRKQKMLAIYFVSVILVGIIILVVTIFKSPIKYGVEFKLDEASFTFYRDGTCKKNAWDECTYEIINDKELHAYGYNYSLGINSEIQFKIIDKYNLEQYMTLYNNVGLTGPLAKYGSIWSANGKSYNVYNNQSVKDEVNDILNDINKPYYKEYTLFTTNSGKKATMTFSSENKCSTKFTQFNNKGSGGLFVNYTDGDCTYEVLSDKQIIIKYLGNVEIGVTQYNSYYRRTDKVVIDKGYVIYDALIEFNDDYSKFEYKNGEWKSVNGEVYYYYFITQEQEKQMKEKDNSNNDDSEDDSSSYNDYKFSSGSNNEVNSSSTSSSSNSNNSYDNNSSYYDYEEDNSSNNTSSNGNNNTSGNIVDDSKINYVNDISFKSTKSNSTYNNYTWTIKLIDKNRSGSFYIVYNDGGGYYAHNDEVFTGVFDKNGENCMDLSVEDKNGYKKDFRVCQTFDASKPSYSVSKVNETDSYCSFNIFRGNGEANLQPYNKESNLDCTLDGEMFYCSNTAVSVGKGSHTLRYTNKYTYSEVKFNC